MSSPFYAALMPIAAQSHPELPLPKTNTKVGELDAYASSDLAVPHPTIPDLWKIIGRADEQIILSNGEKVRIDVTFHRLRRSILQ